MTLSRDEVYRLMATARGDIPASTMLLLTQQKFAEAQPFFRSAWSCTRSPCRAIGGLSMGNGVVGGTLFGQKRFESAEPLLLEGYEGLKQREQRIPASSRVHIREAGERLVQRYEAWGKSAQAAEWKQKLEALPKAE